MTELHPIACYHDWISVIDMSDTENARRFFDRDARWHRDRVAVLDKDHEWFASHSIMMMESLHWVDVIDAHR